MQDIILIISRCTSIKTKVKSKKIFYYFHFKGFYDGNKINLIHLNPIDNNQVFQVGDEYMLWTKKIKIVEDILVVDLIKFKLIN